jgi:hypothetical protein
VEIIISAGALLLTIVADLLDRIVQSPTSTTQPLNSIAATMDLSLVAAVCIATKMMRQSTRQAEIRQVATSMPTVFNVSRQTTFSTVGLQTIWRRAHAGIHLRQRLEKFGAWRWRRIGD